MTNDDLFLALSGVKPEYLEHSEGTAPIRRRTLPRFILIAAVVAALTVTAFAVPYIRGIFRRIYEYESFVPGTVTDIRGESHVYTGMIDVHVDLDMAEDRPRAIEEAYVPMYFVENWEPVPKRLPDTFRNRTEYTSTVMEWTTADGQYILFEQHIVDNSIPGDAEGFELDSVNTGYNEGIQPDQVTLGNYELYRVVVPPSSVEVDGTVYTDEGRRRYYWSDGYYYFLMEINWATEESVVEQAISSLERVDSVYDYMDVAYYHQETLPSGEPREEMLYPTWLPEGWRRCWASVDVNGCYHFTWDYQLPEQQFTSSLRLYQSEGGQAGEIRNWEIGLYKGAEKQVMTIGDWEVTIYWDGTYICAYWYVEDVDYILENGSLEEQLSLEAFVRIIENLEFAENPEALLETPAPETALYPTWLPDGWEPLRAEESGGYYSFTWRHQAEGETTFSCLYLDQVEHGYQMNSRMRCWSGPDAGTKEVRTIGDWEVTVWYNDARIDAFWYIGEVDYVLSSDGENRVSLEELLGILENLQAVEDPASLMTN